MNLFETIILFIFPFFMIYAAFSDLLTMKISNKIVLGLIVIFIALAIFIKMPIAELGMHFGIATIVLIVTFALFSFGWVGGGDAKLAAATALWFGSSITLEYLVYSSMFGGMLTIAILIFRRFPLPFGLDRIIWIARLHKAGSGVPYGIALAFSGLIVYPQTIIFTHFTGQEAFDGGLFYLLEKLLT